MRGNLIGVMLLAMAVWPFRRYIMAAAFVLFFVRAAYKNRELFTPLFTLIKEWIAKRRNKGQEEQIVAIQEPEVIYLEPPGIVKKYAKRHSDNEAALVQFMKQQKITVYNWNEEETVSFLMPGKAQAVTGTPVFKNGQVWEIKYLDENGKKKSLASQAKKDATPKRTKKVTLSRDTMVANAMAWIKKMGNQFTEDCYAADLAGVDYIEIVIPENIITEEEIKVFSDLLVSVANFDRVERQDDRLLLAYFTQ